MIIRICTFIFCAWSPLVFSTISENVVICAVCKDVESRLPYSIEIVENIGSLFNDYRVVVYENNSTDKTPQQLKEWANRNSRVLVLSENLSDSELSKIIYNIKLDGNFFHPEAIARARNKVLDIAMSDKYEAYPYLIWVDMDFKIPPSYEGFIETFGTDIEWDAVFAYGVDPPQTYWDWYAFRNTEYPIGSELLGDYWWYMPKKFKLTDQDDWYPVYSAFGGCGIYKKASIIGCRYSGIVTPDLEKVAKKIIKQGVIYENHLILKYLNDINSLNGIVKINQPAPNLLKILDPNIGIVVSDQTDPLIWRMSFFVYQYPSVCEHVTFHASMILNGYDRIFINPRLKFTYGG